MTEKWLDDRYELIEFVGKGGMALVYKALDHRTNHYVAVKILRPEYNDDQEFLKRFEREAIAASKMSHHNIVNLLDVGFDNDCRYLVMELVEGKTLKELIKEKGALAPNIAVQIAIRILSALQHAHKNGIIHRDIKPQNILVNADGLVKVADFGIARVAGSNTISKADSVMGSVHYFSPEQAKGEDVTFASDIYSVGVVMYEMLTGYVPFDGDTPVSVALQHISASPRPMHELKSDIPLAYERIVFKAMEKKPENRYQSAFDMAQDLHRAMHEPEGDWLNKIQDKPIPAIAPKKPSSRFKEKLRSRRTIYSIMSVGFSVIVLAFMFWGGIGIYHLIVNSTQAPYLLDETETSALRLITKAGLVPQISRVSDEEKPAGTVVLQSPAFDTEMKKGETVFITISTGKEEKQVPNLIGKTVKEAKEILLTLDFTLLVRPNKILSDKKANTVLEQTPKEGEVLKAKGIVEVTVSGGDIVVPDLTELTQEEALQLAEELGLQIVGIKEVPIEEKSKHKCIAAQQFNSKDGKVIYQVGDHVIEGTEGTLAVYVCPNLETQVPSADEVQSK